MILLIQRLFLQLGKNELYGLPILQEAYAYLYNVDVMGTMVKIQQVQQLGKSLKSGLKAKEKGFYAQVSRWTPMNGTLYPFLWQAGGEVITADNQVMINNEAGVEAFEFINKMYTNGWIPKDSIIALEHDALWEGGKMLAVQGSGI